MNQENYFIAVYQAIIERNISKGHFLLTEAERDDYFNEYPNLNFNYIFNGKDPKKFMIFLLTSKEYEDFFMEL